ncbi:MAG: AAA family ATPase [Myxococcales bacterium]|nr:AAA family ATPase [Myxococcales bacterium]MCB9521534.1 AAA family ATPase [Myxococcales bacterium]MCB9534085.1 AAA family ATPase [Myxococcales bacterium]
MTVHCLHRITAKNFRSLGDVSVGLQPLSVLVGPNGAGKSNLLSVVRFLGDTARLDLDAALRQAGGFDRLRFRGATKRFFEIGVHSVVTEYAHAGAVDEYVLKVSPVLRHSANRGLFVFARAERFRFKRTKGRGRRLTVEGSKLSVVDDGAGARAPRAGNLAPTATALSTLPRLGEANGGAALGKLANLLTSLRVFDVDVNLARQPQRTDRDSSKLAADASNLAAFLDYLRTDHPEVLARLEQDLRYVVPGFGSLVFDAVGGAASAVAVGFTETALPGTTALADASFGTVRALALLAMLHDPAPPPLTCVEEVDHGLHPHAIERIVERMREATARTQLLVATHSPTFVNQLRAEELIVCERDPRTGATIAPAISTAEVAAMIEESPLGLGELWFSGALGGSLP